MLVHIHHKEGNDIQTCLGVGVQQGNRPPCCKIVVSSVQCNKSVYAVYEQTGKEGGRVGWPKIVCSTRRLPYPHACPEIFLFRTAAFV